MSEQTKLRNRILGLFVHAGEDGRTDAEIAIAIGASKNVVPCRRRDLELNGLVRKTATKRRTDTGAPASVYVVTQAGISQHQSPDDAPPRPRTTGDTLVAGFKTLLRRTQPFLEQAEPRPTELLNQIDVALA